ncbi:unnamed protein product [Linum tenue]|uniref:Uncharacterized protein n=1 Tax=Linum tenue TaxID=586396 RepID=A0AAV0P466_9ROSI|nr:unnamed protein product [Linum tenue]
MLKKLLLIGGGREKKGAHLAVYIGEELRRFDIPIEYFRHEGFARLLLECRDADAMDFNINLPIEIESCSVERFHRIWRGAVEEEADALRRRRWLWFFFYFPFLFF